MCLISTSPVPMVAQEDIRCYKILEENCTFIVGKYVNSLIRLGLVPLKAKGEIDILPDYVHDIYSIGRGMIHTYGNCPKGAWLHLCQIYECIIPKGTEYFRDKWGTKYCSKQIRFVRRLNVELKQRNRK